jgi:cell pole-organizing protein PopZ
MSKLDPTSESLDSILASIRRSLAEQSTDVLADDNAPPPPPVDLLGDVVPGEDAPPRFLAKGGGQDAGRAAIPLPTDVPFPTGLAIPADRAFAGLDNPPPPTSISAALARSDARPDEGPPAPAAPAAQPPAEEDPTDPLWFLARPEAREKADTSPAPTTPAVAPQPAPAPIAPVQVAPAQVVPTRPAGPAAPVQAPSAAPKPQLKEIVRGPLPPFFGSNPEAANVEMSPTPPVPAQFPLPGSAVILPAAPPPVPATAPVEAQPVLGTAPDPAPPIPAPPAGLVAREGLLNGSASSVPAPPLADTTSPAAPPAQLQGLEGMVADLLRPMLRRWLDENMPRLVSAALKAESETLSKWDPKKP